MTERSAVILTLFGQRVLIEEGGIDARFEGDKLIVRTTARVYPLDCQVRHVVREKDATGRVNDTGGNTT